MDFAIFLMANFPQTGADLKSQPFIFNECHERIRAEFEVGPCLVDLLFNPVNQLLHLLILDVCLQQAARADGLCIAIGLDAPFEVVVRGRDLGMWRGKQLVLRVKVSTRDGFARDGFAAWSLDGEGTPLGDTGLKGSVFLRHLCVGRFATTAKAGRS